MPTVLFEGASDDMRALLKLTGLDRVLPLAASATTPVTTPSPDSPWPDWNRRRGRAARPTPGSASRGRPRPEPRH